MALRSRIRRVFQGPDQAELDLLAERVFRKHFPNVPYPKAKVN